MCYNFLLSFTSESKVVSFLLEWYVRNRGYSCKPYVVYNIRIDFQYGTRQVQRNGESFNNKSTFRTFYTTFWAAYGYTISKVRHIQI